MEPVSPPEVELPVEENTRQKREVSICRVFRYLNNSISISIADAVFIFASKNRDLLINSSD